MPSRIGGSKPKVSVPKKAQKTGDEPLPHFGGTGNVSANRGAGGKSGGVSANRGGGGGGGVSVSRGGGTVSGSRGGGVSVSRGGGMGQGPVSSARGGLGNNDTFNPGKISVNRYGG